MSKLMKKKANDKLRTQATATTIGLIAAAAIFLASFILSTALLNSVRDKVMPLLDLAQAATEAEDYEIVNEMSELISDELGRAEPKLKLFANHHDIVELMRFVDELALIGKDGDKITYMNSISGIRIWLQYIYESNGFTLGIII